MQQSGPEQRKGYSLIPPGQHPGVPKIEVPTEDQMVGDGIEVKIDTDDPLMKAGLDKKAPTTNESVRRIGFETEELPPAEPILDEDPRDIIDVDVFEDLPMTVQEQVAADPILELAGHKPSLEEIQASINSVFKQTGIGRDTMMADFISKVASGSIDAVDVEQRQKLDAMMIETIKAHTTAETVVRDLGFAISEQGAKVVFDTANFEKIIQGLVHIAQLRKLIKFYGLEDYEQIIVLDQIDKVIGRSKALENEQRVLDGKRDRQYANIMSLISQAINSIQGISLQAQDAPKKSPFLKTSES